MRVGAGWLYLATVIDIATRRLIGWSITTHLRTGLVTDALNAAVAALGGQVDVIFHSDHGSQGDFADACRRHGIRRSMGRIGSSYDNALAESFFATLKRELDVNNRSWANEADARRACSGGSPSTTTDAATPRWATSAPPTTNRPDYPASDRGITRCPHPGGTSTHAMTHLYAGGTPKPVSFYTTRRDATSTPERLWCSGGARMFHT